MKVLFKMFHAGNVALVKVNFWKACVKKSREEFNENVRQKRNFIRTFKKKISDSATEACGHHLTVDQTKFVCFVLISQKKSFDFVEQDTKFIERSNASQKNNFTECTHPFLLMLKLLHNINTNC